MLGVKTFRKSNVAGDDIRKSNVATEDIRNLNVWRDDRFKRLEWSGQVCLACYQLTT